MTLGCISCSHEWWWCLEKILDSRGNLAEYENFPWAGRMYVVKSWLCSWWQACYNSSARQCKWYLHNNSCCIGVNFGRIFLSHSGYVVDCLVSKLHCWLLALINVTSDSVWIFSGTLLRIFKQWPIWGQEIHFIHFCIAHSYRSENDRHSCLLNKGNELILKFSKNKL